MLGEEKGRRRSDEQKDLAESMIVTKGGERKERFKVVKKGAS